MNKIISFYKKIDYYLIKVVYISKRKRLICQGTKNIWVVHVKLVALLFALIGSVLFHVSF